MTKLLETLEAKLAELDEKSLRRHRRTASTACDAIVEVDGRRMISFCSFDYLGLAAHPKLKLAMQAGVERYGLSSGASHLISGHSRAHQMLEERLAHHLSPHIPHANALYFGSGYMANLAVLSTLAALGEQGETELFCEQLNHASLIDGARLARAKLSIYPHADVPALAKLLQQSKAKLKIVATDGVFSMDGDIAPLSEIVRLCEQHDAWAVVDDAHGFGVVGQGAGVLAHHRLCSQHLVYMGTLGKAAGVSGAFVAAHERVIEWLIQRARPYIYSTASPPALAHALLTSLDIIFSEEGDARRAHLQSLITQFRASFGFDSHTHIQPVIVGSNAATLQLAAQLYEAGIWVPAIRPPTVPEGTGRLRVSLSAAHTHEQVALLVDSLDRLQRKAA